MKSLKDFIIIYLIFLIFWSSLSPSLLVSLYWGEIDRHSLDSHSNNCSSGDKKDGNEEGNRQYKGLAPSCRVWMGMEREGGKREKEGSL